MIWYNLNSIKSYIGTDRFVVSDVTAAFLLDLSNNIIRPYVVLSDSVPSLDCGLVKVKHVNNLDRYKIKCVDGLCVTDEISTVIDMINNNSDVATICDSIETLLTCNTYSYYIFDLIELIAPYLTTNKLPLEYYLEMVIDYED